MKDKEWKHKLMMDVQYQLMQNFQKMGMSTPDNFNAIVKYCVEDVEECADEEYSEGDITIAFHRFIESVPEELADQIRGVKL